MLSFTPTNLNEENVNMLFKQCLATAQTQKPLRCILFQKEKGFPQDSRPIFFDGDIIEEATPVIEFVLGQLKAVHQKESSITTTSVKTTYQNIEWTNNKNLIITLLHLATAANLISPIDAKTANMYFLKELFPTLSTSDQNYVKWEENNIMTLKKLYKEGQEPADD